MRANPILDTDSYKPSHFLQLPPNTAGTYLIVTVLLAGWIAKSFM